MFQSFKNLFRNKAEREVFQNCSVAQRVLLRRGIPLAVLNGHKVKPSWKSNTKRGPGRIPSRQY